VKTRTILIISIVLAYSHCKAQNYSWIQTNGNTGVDSGKSIVTDDFGNVYTTGSFEGTIDFDPSTGLSALTSMGSSDVFILKQNADGKIIWAKSAGDIGYDTGNSIAIDDQNNVYISGEYDGNIDFDNNDEIGQLNSVGQADSFLLKLDSNGEFVWVKNIGGAYNEYNAIVSIGDAGDIFVSGTFYMSISIEVGNETISLSNEGNRDIFVLKSDSNGEFEWIKQISGQFSLQANAIQVDEYENIYLTGLFVGVVDFDPSSEDYLVSGDWNFDFFIVKLDPNGNFLWVYTLADGGDMDYGNSLALDGMGNVYVTGGYGGIIDFDSGPNTNLGFSFGERDLFIMKLTDLGSFQWFKSIGSTGLDFAKSIGIDSTGKIYLTGSFSETVDFNPGNDVFNLTSLGDLDIFVASMDTDGNLLWATRAGGSSEDIGIALAADRYCKVSVTGFFTDSFIYNYENTNNELFGEGDKDIFVAKIALTSTPEIFAGKLLSYPNPTTNYSTIQLNHIQEEVEIKVLNSLGQVVNINKYVCVEKIHVELPYEAGMYIIELTSQGAKSIIKVNKI
jgi:Secretion system C-terminal sorting domain